MRKTGEIMQKRDNLSSISSESLGITELEATALVIDIKEYTQACNRYSRKAIYESLFKYRNIVRGAVNEMRGLYVNDFGDAVFALFGVQPRTPGHVVDSVIAAMDIQKYLSSSDMLLKDARIGISKGVMAISNDKKLDANGEAINLASRLQTLGKDGSIAVSDEIHYDVNNLFNMKNEGIMPIKGVGARNIYSVVGVKRAYESLGEKRLETVDDEVCKIISQYFKGQDFVKLDAVEGEPLTTQKTAIIAGDICNNFGCDDKTRELVQKTVLLYALGKSNLDSKELTTKYEDRVKVVSLLGRINDYAQRYATQRGMVDAIPLLRDLRGDKNTLESDIITAAQILVALKSPKYYNRKPEEDIYSAMKKELDKRGTSEKIMPHIENYCRAA